MILNTNTIISSKFPLKSIRIITNCYRDVITESYINVELDTELPLYMCDTERFLQYDYGLNKYLFQNYTEYFNFLTGPFKVLGEKFYTCFQSLGGLKKYMTSTKTYYIGKGIITDAQFQPLILTTYKITNDDIERLNYEVSNNNRGRALSMFHVNQSNLKIYISRHIYSDTFREEDKRLYKEIFTSILPKLMELDVPITIKRDLNMFMRTFVNPSLNNEQLQEKYKLEANDAKRIITERLQ